MQLGYTYGGVVEVNQDPLKLGRLKVRVPHVYGTQNNADGYIGTGELPWALPAGMPAGGSANSGGFSHLPGRGDKVWVRFLDGEPEKPIWEWGMQSIGDADTLNLHSYAKLPTPIGAPDRAFWTRYGHAFEMNEGSLIATTSQGYRAVLTDSSAPGTADGNIMVSTQNGNFVSLDDLDDTAKIFSVEDMYVYVGSGFLGLSDSFSWSTLSGEFNVSAGQGIGLTSAGDISLTTSASVTVDALGDTLLGTQGLFTVGGSFIRIGFAATQPAVLGADLVLLFEGIYAWLALHTHTSSEAGSPTSQPLQPVATITPSISSILSATVTVQD